MSLYKGTKLVAGRLPSSTDAMIYKGECLQSALPTSGQVKCDFYILTDESGEYKGKFAVWNGSAWDYSKNGAGTVAVDNTTIVFDENGKLHASINAYETNSSQTMIIGVKNVAKAYDSVNIYSFESNEVGETNKFVNGDVVKGKLVIDSEEFEFEETAEQVTIPKGETGEEIKKSGVTMTKEAMGGVYLYLCYDEDEGKFLLCSFGEDLSTHIAGFNLNASLVSHTIKKVDNKFINYDGVTIKVNDDGNLYAASSGAECDDTSIIKNNENKLSVSYGGKYVETLASLVLRIIVGDQIATNIYKVASEGVPELSDFGEDEKLKGEVEMSGETLGFEGTASSISIPKGDPSMGEMFDFIGVTIVEEIPGLGVSAYFGKYTDEVTGENAYIVAIHEGDASAIINDIQLNVYKAGVDYDTIKPQVIPYDETIEISGSNKLKVRFEANPELEGSETSLTGIEWKGVKYKVSGGEVDVATKEETKNYLTDNIVGLEVNITNGTATHGGHALKDQDTTIVLTPDEGYLLPNQDDISVENATIVSYDKDAGTLVIGSATGNVKVDLSCVEKPYDITVDVANGTSEGDTEIGKEVGATATITIKPDDGFILPFDTTSINISNAEISSYDNLSGKLVINNPTDNVAISVVLEAKPYNGLSFQAIEDNSSFTFVPTGSPDVTLQYSEDGTLWADLAFNQEVTMVKGKRLYIRNTKNTFSISGSSCISIAMTGTIDASGNIMSLVNFSAISSYSFYKLFNKDNDDNNSLRSIKDLVLPATDIPQSAYCMMFRRCKKIIDAPDLSAIASITDGGCQSMFNNSSLKVSNDPAKGKLFITIPAGATENSVLYMFSNTPGAFSDTPVAGASYYYYE